MQKSFATDDHSDLAKAAGGRMFQFFDRSDKMTKSASDAIDRKLIQEHMPPDTHFGVHAVTMGMEEVFGPNRNGDSASRKSLNDHHHTFEKFGCIYREHNNRCPRTQGIGEVRVARVNNVAGRGELLAWISKDKAPDMYKKAKAGEELSWSMSMRLPYDECSCCGKKSRTTADYCGDLRDHMLQWRPGFKKYAYARNEKDVKFFDLSEVERRADRVATYLRYFFGDDDSMRKAASAGDLVIPGAEWARLKSGDDMIVPLSPWEESTLEKMAEAAAFVDRASPETRATLLAMAPRTLDRDQVETLAKADFRNAAGELAKRAMFIDFPTFASVVTGKTFDELGKEAGFTDVLGVKLPALLQELFANGGCGCGHEVASAVEPDESGTQFTSEKDSIDRLMRDVGGDLGMKPENTSDRALSITIVKSAAALSGTTPKEARTDAFYDGMAEAYGHYVVKAAHIAASVPGVSEVTLHRVLAASLSKWSA